MFDSDIIVWPHLSKIVGVATASPPNAACSPPGGDSLNSAETAAEPFGETKGSTGDNLDEPFVTSQGPKHVLKVNVPDGTSSIFLCCECSLCHEG